LAGIVRGSDLPLFEGLLDLVPQIPVHGVPKYLLLLSAVFHPLIMDATAPKIVYIRHGPCIRHSVPLEEPFAREPLGLDR
jgi:hypothetical protein